MGGVARRATALRDLKRNNREVPLLVVETGNALKQTDDLDNPMNRWVVEALNTLGTDVVNATNSDLHRLNKLMESGRLPEHDRTTYVASTVKAQPSDRFPVKPYVLQSLRPDQGSQEVRVGVLAVSAGADVAGTPEAAMSEDEAIRRYLPELDAEADLVVLLARMSPEGLASLARRFPAIDVIINGNSTGEGREFPRVGNTVIVESAHAGVALGVLQLEWDSQGHISRSQNQLIPLPPMMRDDPELARVAESARREAADFEEEEARKSPPVTVPSIYASAAACKTCHEKEYQVWQKSAHARAIESLKLEHNHYNKDCLPCHVTGFDMDRGYVNLLRTPELAGVQCEACHGISSDHARDPVHVHPGLGVYQLDRHKVKQTSCTRCHSEDRSPGFAFDVYWSKIAH